VAADRPPVNWAPSLLPRSRRRALVGTAATLWLPTVLPLFAGPLRECDHCVGNYAALLPVVPGVLAPTLLQLDGATFGLVAGGVTLALFGIVYAFWRELPRWLLPVAVAIAASLIGLEAFGFAVALRG
jgi:hypothetical protein